jgi:hypothetical protein
MSLHVEDIKRVAIISQLHRKEQWWSPNLFPIVTAVPEGVASIFPVWQDVAIR